MRDYEFIGSKLYQDTAVKTVVSSRIYHGRIPEQDVTYPVINYILISRPNVCFGHGERPRYQINCRAETPATAMDLAHKVHSVFNDLQGSTAGFDCDGAYFENSLMIAEQNDIYNVAVDIFLTYRNTTST